MNRKAKATIFLAQGGGVQDTANSSSAHIFNFGGFFREHRQPFGNIFLVNDDSLDADVSLEATIEKNSYLVLVPVMGAIGVKDSSGKESLLAAGQMQVSGSGSNETIRIQNPFKEGIVNFLQVGIKAEHAASLPAHFLFDYDINEEPDSLVKIPADDSGASQFPFSIFIGKFKGRGETTLRLKNESHSIFAFVINGAFEVQGRLLHAGDALALWDTNEVEIEAFSNDAIIFVIEQAADSNR